MNSACDFRKLVPRIVWIIVLIIQTFYNKFSILLVNNEHKGNTLLRPTNSTSFLCNKVFSELNQKLSKQLISLLCQQYNRLLLIKKPHVLKSIICIKTSLDSPYKYNNNDVLQYTAKWQILREFIFLTQ